MNKYKVNNYYWYIAKHSHAKCIHATEHRIYMALKSRWTNTIMFFHFKIDGEMCKRFVQMSKTEIVLYADDRLNDITIGTLCAFVKSKQGDEINGKFAMHR